ncbi:hypothetical protein KIH23_04985 [Flavobacterium sp. CYK-55]|uniref:hypothetical protein n=1 Tax=Flavobacterium sp. CYK-55 TaxID=2835529 RepID=UPI001BCC615E|nr:hypothetical protein [Flavobacterium sp. CYK-55]MBS7786643.1 hypothetical protein [Flavobacterium sp. CYK-55]
MKKVGCAIIGLFIFVLLASFSVAQAPKESSYSKEQIEHFIREVYAESAEGLFFKNNSLRLKYTTDFLQRVHIVLNPKYKNSKLPLLSSIALVNDYNPNLKRELVFDPNSFNPLKYDFAMFNKSRLIVVVDQTDYAIVIEPSKY